MAIKISGNTVIDDSKNICNISDVTATGTITLNGVVYPGSDGTCGQVLKTDGSGTLSFGDDVGTVCVETITTTSTWTKPAGVSKVYVEVISAGGGGGTGCCLSAPPAPSSAAGTGGGGGGYASNLYDAPYITPTVCVVIGAGGCGSITHGTPGGDGGASCFGSYLRVLGGCGGVHAVPGGCFRGDGGVLALTGPFCSNFCISTPSPQGCYAPGGVGHVRGAGAGVAWQRSEYYAFRNSVYGGGGGGDKSRNHPQVSPFPAKGGDSGWGGGGGGGGGQRCLSPTTLSTNPGPGGCTCYGDMGGCGGAGGAVNFNGQNGCNYGGGGGGGGGTLSNNVFRCGGCGAPGVVRITTW